MNIAARLEKAERIVGAETNIKDAVFAHIDAKDADPDIKAALRFSVGAVLDGYREQLPEPWAHFADVQIEKWRESNR